MLFQTTDEEECKNCPMCVTSKKMLYNIERFKTCTRLIRVLLNSIRVEKQAIT